MSNGEIKITLHGDGTAWTAVVHRIVEKPMLGTRKYSCSIWYSLVHQSGDGVREFERFYGDTKETAFKKALLYLHDQLWDCLQKEIESRGDS